jgi:hypothetical protein
MDPTACWKQFVENLTDPNATVEETIEPGNNLLQWLKKGGAMPTIRPEDFVVMLEAFLETF